MKKLLLVISLLTLPLAALAGSWTVMVWLNNQNNLKTYGWDDVNEMEDCNYSAYPDGVDVIVMVGWDPDNSTRLFHIQTDPDGYSSGDYEDIVSTEITGHGIWTGNTADMDDPQIFENFVGWVTDNYPADNYLLDAWDHGSGIFLQDETKDWIDRGMCSDLKIWQIEQALENVGEFIDVIGFDVCLGGQIENGYQYLDDAGICIASEDSEPGDGWDYQAFNIFEEDTSVTPEEIAVRIVNDYLDFYGGGVTQAAQNVKNWSTVMEEDWADLCQSLFDNCYTYQDRITTARSSADYWNTSDDRDLYQFVEALAGDGSLPGALRTKAAQVVVDLEDYVFAGGMHSTIDSGDGMAVYFPTNGSDHPNWTTYTTLINFSDTLWDEFLEMYADPYPVQPVAIAFESVVYDDSVGGNGDGNLDPGETIDATVTLINEGTDAASGVAATLSIDDAYFTVTDSSGDFGSIPAGGTASGTFQFVVGSFCPDHYFTNADLAITADGGYTTEATFAIVVGVGFEDDVESGEGLWTHGGTGDQWHVSTEDAHSPTHSWKCGDTGSGQYGNGQNSWIKTCPIFVDADYNELSFWTRYDLEAGFDFVYLDVSVGGGAWVQKDVFSGTNLDWTRKRYDFSAYTDETVEVRFRFSSDGGLTLEGFYFDDVSMAEQTSDIGSVAFSGEAADDGILLSWRPDNPAEITGVNLLREDGDRYVRLNEIPLTGGRYLDLDAAPGKSYRYELEALGSDGSRNVFGPIEVSGSGIGARFTRLDPCYPCPAGAVATVPFTLAADGSVRIDVYDLAGRLVQTVVRGEFAAGRHEVSWRTDGIANGVYIVRLTSGPTTATQRTVVSR
jgi:hypothetical protein